MIIRLLATYIYLFIEAQKAQTFSLECTKVKLLILNNFGGTSNHLANINLSMQVYYVQPATRPFWKVRKGHWCMDFLEDVPKSKFKARLIPYPLSMDQFSWTNFFELVLWKIQKFLEKNADVPPNQNITSLFC